MTTTEEANWDWLRAHPDAQPEIHELALQMQLAKQNEPEPFELWRGEWHVPYVDRCRDPGAGDLYYSVNNIPVSLEDAKMISASCCAQVSYRKSDDSLDKAKMIFDRLINSTPVHASPVEHQATPIDYDYYLPEGVITDGDWAAAQGITHQFTDGGLGSGNFRDWIQFRQLIPNNTKW